MLWLVRCEICGERLSWRRLLHNVRRSPRHIAYVTVTVDGTLTRQPVVWLCGQCEATAVLRQSMKPAAPVQEGHPSRSIPPSPPLLAASPASAAPPPADCAVIVDECLHALSCSWDPATGLTLQEYLRRYLPGAVQLRMLQQSLPDGVPYGLPAHPPPGGTGAEGSPRTPSDALPPDLSFFPERSKRPVRPRGRRRQLPSGDRAH